MATYTATLYSATPKAVHVGVNNVSATYTITGSTSISDVILWAKIPHGAILVDCYEAHTASGNAAMGAALGLSNGADGVADSSFFTTASAMGTNRFAKGTSAIRVVSVSASDPNPYGVLVTTVSTGSMTTGAQFWVNFSYRVDG